MTQHIDIHDQARHLPAQLRKLEDDTLDPDDAKQIRRFADDCLAEGLSPGRAAKYVGLLRKLASLHVEPFEPWTKTEVSAVLRKIEASDYAEWTKRDFRITLKRFFRWLRGTEDGYPPEVRWIKTTIRRQATTLPEELLTEDEVRKLVEAAPSLRDKAFMFTLYESGCRIGEVANLRLKHIQFDDYGAQIVVSGKTGQRRVRLIAAVPALAKWMEAHPLRADPGSPLWVNIGNLNHSQAMKYAGMTAILKRATRKAGIKKRVHPHLFRHSRATHLANQLTDAQMKVHFGWTQGSEMASTYVHLSGRDVDEALLRLNGLKHDQHQKRQDKLKPQKCARCRSANSAEARYCSQCRMPLDIQTVLATEEERRPDDDLLSELARDPRVREALLQTLQELPPERRRALAAAAGRARAA